MPYECFALTVHATQTGIIRGCVCISMFCIDDHVERIGTSWGCRSTREPRLRNCQVCTGIAFPNQRFTLTHGLSKRRGSVSEEAGRLRKSPPNADARGPLRGVSSPFLVTCAHLQVVVGQLYGHGVQRTCQRPCHLFMGDVAL